MKLTKLTAAEFVPMILAGAKRLEENVELVNALNVFPVPDGDTGTNMNMTFQSGAQNLQSTTTEHVGDLTSALAKGLLMGARGNSGVILSQIFRGFNLTVKEKDTLDATDFAAAFAGGVESAYKAVMKPVEGTILTVARESAIRGEKKARKTDDIIEVMQSIVRGAKEALDKTPDLLPVLKQVGVVDSGGKGLLCVYEGFLSALTGETIVEVTKEASHAGHAHAMFEGTEENPMSMDDITFGYCTEIMVRIGENPQTDKAFDYDAFRNTLNDMGDSLLVVADDEIIKVHVHTEDPGKVMRLGQEYGELIKIKVDNMREQVRGLEAEEAQLNAAANQTVTSASLASAMKAKFAIIAVAAGEGVMELFTSLGVKEVLSGGQTMNPSTEDFIKAIERANAENIILLPNNKNIIMAAEQATQVADIPAVVIPTTTIPQGIASLMAFTDASSLEENKEQMTQMMQHITSGQITYSIRDTEIDGVEIKKDDFLGLVNNKIVLSESNLETALSSTLDYMLNEDSEIVTIVIGEDGDEAIVESVETRITDIYPDIEVEIVKGQQPVYHYIISVE